MVKTLELESWNLKPIQADTDFDSETPISANTS